jgi:hypothetical protein
VGVVLTNVWGLFLLSFGGCFDQRLGVVSTLKFIHSRTLSVLPNAQLPVPPFLFFLVSRRWYPKPRKYVLFFVSSQTTDARLLLLGSFQVHGPDGQNFFWPGGMVKYVNGQETDLYEDYAGSVADWHLSLQGWSSAEALMLLQKRRREARLAAKDGDLTKLTRIGLKLDSVRDNHKRTLLHVAAKFGQTEVVKYLLKEFKEHLVGQQDIDHYTAMDFAVAEKHDDVAQLIKDAGGGLTGEMLRKGLTLAVRDLNLEVIYSCRPLLLLLRCVTLSCHL